MKVLGIETSCDDTCLALYDKESGLVFNKKFVQKKLTNLFGGVVPELAARIHIKQLIRFLKIFIKNNNISFKELSAIAYTGGPGLINCLLVGAHIAYGLGYVNNLPIIPVNHLEAHLLTPFLKRRNFNKKNIYPFLGLIISGGNTQLIAAHDLNNYQILGKNLDDPLGEVFDKISILLDLPSPGGESLAKLAKQGDKIYNFPKPITKDFNFSFSGLKTAVINFIKDNIFHIKKNFKIKANIAKSFESTVIELLSNKCRKAMLFTNFKKIIIAGGVSANVSLRNSFKIANNYIKGSKCIFSPISLCADNAAMIAYTGLMKLIYNKTYKISFLNCIKVDPHWSINNNIL